MSWSGKNLNIQGAFTREDIERVIEKADGTCLVRKAPKGAILFWEQEACKNQYFVIDGMVEIYATDVSGRKKSIDYYAAGSLVGFQILKADNTAMTTARVLMDSTLIVITKKLFFDMFHADDEFSENVLRYLFGLLSMQTEEVICSSFMDSQQRLAALLLGLALDAAENEPGGAEPVLKLGNSNLAEMLGVSRNSVTSALAGLQEQRIVEKKRGGLRIIDVGRLEKIARSV